MVIVGRRVSQLDKHALGLGIDKFAFLKDKVELLLGLNGRRSDFLAQLQRFP